MAIFSWFSNFDYPESYFFPTWQLFPCTNIILTFLRSSEHLLFSSISKLYPLKLPLRMMSFNFYLGDLRFTNGLLEDMT